MLNPNVNVITVSKLNLYLKSLMDGDPILNNILVKGEVTNLKYYPSGHIYFSLKDEEGVVKCVMFSTYASSLTETLNEGEKIIVSGSVSVYGANGTYQLYVRAIEKDGLGNLYLEFERLKRELMEKGLFSEEHKLPIPSFPLNIAIVSGKTAAGLKDVITIIKRRWDLADITIFPCLVQGKEAPASIINALEQSKTIKPDVTLLVRGGGSQEDLFCFNDESLAYAIYNYPYPIVSGVGHEIDYTIADFVSDVRAPTPSAAAELITPNKEDLLESIKNIENSLLSKARSIVDDKRVLLADYETYLTKESFDKLVSKKRDELTDRKLDLKNSYYNFSSLYKKEIEDNLEKLKVNYDSYLFKKRKDAENEISILDNISPLKVLSRGYSVVSNTNGTIDSIDKVNVGEMVRIRFKDGRAYANITRKDEEHGK